MAPTSATVVSRAGRRDEAERARATAERNELFTRLAAADRLLSLGALAAGVAHEINTPLAYLTMNLDLVARELEALFEGGATPATLTSALADARDGAVRVSAIVRELRALSCAGEDQTEALDVGEVIAASARIVDHELRGRARLVVSLPTDLPLVRGNAARLGQVFVNLLLNAIQALPEGDPTPHEIRVRARALGGEGAVEIDVEDTGRGIAAAILGRIFDPFFTTKPAGTGLGLAVCRRIVAALGGEVRAANVPGGGAAITVRLRDAFAAAVTTPPGAPIEPVLRRRILLVDDEANFGRLVGSLLRPDHEVTSVTRAREALDLLAAGAEFDAILCDLTMPGMNGDDFYRELADRSLPLAERVIFMTGGAFTRETSAFLEQVGNARIDKPFSTAALLEAIAVAVRRGERA